MCYFREVQAKCYAAINPRLAEKKKRILERGEMPMSQMPQRIGAGADSINTGLILHARYPPVFDSAAAWQSHQTPMFGVPHLQAVGFRVWGMSLCS